jgi:hypothetical protein
VFEATRINCPPVLTGKSGARGRRVKLICEPAPRGTSHTKASKAVRRRGGKPGRGRRKPPRHFVIYCKRA